MPRTLEEVLADWSEQANVLRKRKHAAEADSIDEIVDEVRTAAEDYIVFLTEREAMLWSGKGADYLRSHRPAWERDGHARRSSHNARLWLYRRCALPRGAQLDAARADAERAALGENPEARSA